MSSVVLRNLKELDEHIARLLEVQARSYSEWLNQRLSFTLLEDVAALPSDPLSPEYKSAQLELYKSISGRVSYSPWDVEPIPIILEQAIDPHPYPFITKSPEHIGNHFIQLGHILRTCSVAAPTANSLIEFGCGAQGDRIWLNFRRSAHH